MGSALVALRQPVIQHIAADEGVSRADLLGLIASRELALDWVEDGASHQERATALTMLASQEEEGAARRALLERAIDATRAGLAVAPADPKDWMQLAYRLVLLEGDVNRPAAEALLMSIRTAGFGAPEFLNRRLFWSLAHWPFYDEHERRQVGAQVRLAWRVAPGALADLALAVPEFFVPVASALEDVPGAQKQFVAALAFATPSSRSAAPMTTAR
jgi:hypothetical protein